MHTNGNRVTPEGSFVQDLDRLSFDEAEFEQTPLDLCVIDARVRIVRPDTIDDTNKSAADLTECQGRRRRGDLLRADVLSHDSIPVLMPEAFHAARPGARKNIAKSID